MNEVLFLGEFCLIFGLLAILGKQKKIIFLIFWQIIALIIANLQCIKIVELFGIENTLGNIVFASIFFTDNLIIMYKGKNIAQKAIQFSFLANIVFMILMQISMFYIPTLAQVSTNKNMQIFFNYNVRTSLASMLMFWCAHYLNIYFSQSLLKNKKYNSFIGCIVNGFCNCLENFGFSFLAFGGILPLNIILTISLSTSVLELIIACLSIPFARLALKN